MMYHKCQQFIVTLLLFSILLQSCGNPNCRMLASATADISDKTSKPGSLAPLARVNQQEDNSERTAEASSASRINRSSEAMVEVASEASSTRANALSSQAHGGGQSSTPSSSFSRSSVAPARQLTQAARPSSGSKRPLQHVASKPQHAVPGKAAASPQAPHGKRPALHHSSHQIGPSDRTTQLSRPLQCATHPSRTEVKSRADDTAHQTPSRATLSSAAQLYPSAQGHQVHFQEENGAWRAQVEDVWGCTQKLPVVCAPDKRLKEPSSS